MRVRTAQRMVGLSMVVALVASACAQVSPTVVETSPTVVDAATGGVDDPSATAVSGGEGTADDGAGPLLNLSASPLPVVFVEDASRASTVEIGPGGGMVSAVDANGTTYTLTVPEGALLGTLPIRMTPIGLGESPLEDGIAFGVAMEPDGLVFLEAATLEIAGPGFDPATAVGFSTDGDGEDFGARPAGFDGDTAILDVPHFSQSGVITTNSMEVAAILESYTPSSRERRHLQEWTMRERRSGTPAEQAREFSRIAAGWLEEIAKEAEIAGDEAAVETLVGEYFTVAALLHRLKQDAPDEYARYEGEIQRLLVEAGRSLQGAAARMFDRQKSRCVDESDPDALFAMVKWALLYIVFGATTDDYSLLEEMDAATRQCLRFEVVFTSTIDDEWFAEVESTVLMEVPESKSVFGEVAGDTIDSLIVVGPISGRLQGVGKAQRLECSTDANVDVALELHYNPIYGAVGDWVVPATGDRRFEQEFVSVRFSSETNWQCAGFDVRQALWLPWFVTAFADLRRDASGFYRFEPERTSNLGVWRSVSDERAAEGVEVGYELFLLHRPTSP